MFETYGKEFDFVAAQNKHNVFTIFDENGSVAIANGLRGINRIGYLITKEKWTGADQYAFKI